MAFSAPTTQSSTIIPPMQHLGAHFLEQALLVLPTQWQTDELILNHSLFSPKWQEELNSHPTWTPYKTLYLLCVPSWKGVSVTITDILINVRNILLVTSRTLGPIVRRWLVATPFSGAKETWNMNIQNIDWWWHDRGSHGYGQPGGHTEKVL